MTVKLNKEILWVAVLFILSQWVYLKTLAPTVTAEDSGELITAAVHLGVPHPPGFPLWTIIGKLFSFLPFQSPARALNYMSAFFAGLTVILVCLIARQLQQRLPISLFAAVIYAFSRHFWSQSIIAEVYTLHVFLFAGTLLFLFKWKTGKRPLNLYLTAVFFGLGLTNHYMLTLLAAPAFFLYLIHSFGGAKPIPADTSSGSAQTRPDKVAAGKRKTKKKSQSQKRRNQHSPKKNEGFLPRKALGEILWLQLKTWPWKPLGFCLLLITATLSIYLYLPWAASKAPPVNWGDPSSLERFWDVITRKLYRSLEFQELEPVTRGTKLLFLGHFSALLLIQFTPYLTVIGLVLGCARNIGKIAERLLFAAIIFFNGPVLIGLLHFTYNQENASRFEEYYLQSWLCIALILGMGLQKLLRKQPESVVWSVAVAAAMVPALSHYRTNDMSNYYLAYDYNKTILESLEKDAVIFPSGDYSSFPLLYLQSVEGLRPDVILAGYSGASLTKPAAAYLKGLSPEATAADTKEAQEIMITQGRRPVYVADKSDFRLMGKFRLIPWGWVFRVDMPKNPYLADTDQPDGHGGLNPGSFHSSIPSHASSFGPNRFFPQSGSLYHGSPFGHAGSRAGRRPYSRFQDSSFTSNRFEDPFNQMARLRAKGVSAETILRNVKDPTVMDDMAFLILASAYLLDGENAAEAKNMIKAIENYRTAGKYGKYSREFLNNLGSTCLEKRLYRLGEMFLRQAVDMAPSYGTARMNLARYYDTSQKWPQAYFLYQDLARLRPNDLEIRERLDDLKKKLRE